MDEFIMAGEAAKALGMRRYRLDYLIETGVFEEPRRVGNRRVWTADGIEAMRQRLAAYEGKRQRKSGNKADAGAAPGEGRLSLEGDGHD